MNIVCETEMKDYLCSLSEFTGYDQLCNIYTRWWLRACITTNYSIRFPRDRDKKKIIIMQSINLISFNVTRTIVSHVKFTSNSREKSPRTIWISMKMRIFHVKPMLHVSENHVNVLSMWKLTRGTFAVQCILNATMDETVWKIKDIKRERTIPLCLRYKLYMSDCFVTIIAKSDYVCIFIWIWSWKSSNYIQWQQILLWGLIIYIYM